MAVRQTNGSSDALVMLPGATVGMDSGPSTLACLIKRNNTNGAGFMVGANNATTGSSSFAQDMAMWTISTTNINRSETTAGSDANPAIPWVNADGWCLIVTTKATGSVTPRFHLYKLTGATITRADGAVALPDSTAVSSTHRWEFGKDEHFNKFAASYAAAAVWNVALSDAQVDELFANLRTCDWFTNTAGAPKALWEFNQSNVSLAVPDLTGGGANQEAIAGTTVVQGDDPPGWTFASTDRLQPRPFNAIPFMR